MIDLNSRELLLSLLNNLSSSTIAILGKMTSQHMIEHLIITLKISSNKIPAVSYFSEEKAQAIKQAIIYSPIEMPIGFKSPLLSDELDYFLHDNL